MEAEEETAYAGWATETERIAGVIEIDIGEVHTTTKNTWKKESTGENKTSGRKTIEEKGLNSKKYDIKGAKNIKGNNI